MRMLEREAAPFRTPLFPIVAGDKVEKGSAFANGNSCGWPPCNRGPAARIVFESWRATFRVRAARERWQPYARLGFGFGVAASERMPRRQKSCCAHRRVCSSWRCNANDSVAPGLWNIVDAIVLLADSTVFGRLRSDFRKSPRDRCALRGSVSIQTGGW